MPPARLHRLERLNLFRDERAVDRLAEQLGATEDRVQRRAKLVAHIRQKLVFEPGGAGQLGVGLTQISGALGNP